VGRANGAKFVPATPGQNRSGSILCYGAAGVKFSQNICYVSSSPPLYRNFVGRISAT
jgi:hypothetical protein